MYGIVHASMLASTHAHTLTLSLSLSQTHTHTHTERVHNVAN
jgi:hypothetical protein